MTLREFAKIAVGSCKGGSKETMPKTVKDGAGATDKHIKQIANRKIDVGEDRGNSTVKK